MPSASLSPHLTPSSTAPTSPRINPANHTAAVAARPALMKRHSTQSTHVTSRHQSQHSQNAISPGSVTNDHQQLRHHVKPRHGHAKVVLSRNHSSARNLGKLGQQKQAQLQQQQLLQFPQADDGRRHTRQRSHEGDTEIRLPGSLDESRPPPMRRNMTAYQLPRSSSHAKLKKNNSHGHLGKLTSSRNLAALNSTTHKAPPSPGLKGRGKRRKSEEPVDDELDLHEQEVALARQQQMRREVPKRVGFAVGSPEDSSGGDDAPQMEGSSLQEDEWTEESASASPYSTRQNTANNSRRESVAQDNKTPDPHAVGSALAGRESVRSPLRNEGWQSGNRRGEVEQKDASKLAQDEGRSKATAAMQLSEVSPVVDAPEVLQSTERQPTARPPAQKSPLQQAKEHSNPATRHLLNRSQQLPAPALVSNVSALDDGRSIRSSPAPSITSSHTNLAEHGSAADPEQEELVSRFVASGPHHAASRSESNVALRTAGSGVVSSHNTNHDNSVPVASDTSFGRRDPINSVASFNTGSGSPGDSNISGSSGATTPALGRSRTELRLLQEKVLAEMESAAERQPVLPAHVYDRRNESLKFHMNFGGANPQTPIQHHGNGDTNSIHMAFSPNTAANFSGIPAGHPYAVAPPMGPEMFQGRFRAVNTELRVVQKFRDPIAEAVGRLKGCKGSAIRQMVKKEKEGGLTSSVVANGRSGPASQSTSGSPQKPHSRTVSKGVPAATQLHASTLPKSVSSGHLTIASNSVDDDSVLTPAATSTASGNGSPIKQALSSQHLSGSPHVASPASATQQIPGAAPSVAVPPSALSRTNSAAAGAAIVGIDPRSRQRREVSFARTPPQTLEFERSKEELALLPPETVARLLWESI